MDQIAPTVNVCWRINPDSELSALLRGYGVRRLAGEVGVSPQTVSNWVSGSVTMEDADLVKVCARVGVRVPNVRYAQGAPTAGTRAAPRLRFVDAMIRKRAAARAGGPE
jgi:transcriptional regulator with XRE-family HTH domain